MLKKFFSPSKSVLIVGFLLVLVLLSGITTYAVSRIHYSNDYIYDLESISSILQKTILLRDEYYGRSRLLEAIVKQKDIDSRNKLYDEYNSYVVDSTLNLRDLDRSVKNSIDKVFLAATHKSSKVVLTLEKNVINMVLAGDVQTAQDIINTQIIPLHEDVVYQLALLYHSTKFNLDDNIRSIVQENDKSINFIILISVIAIILGLLITRFVIRSIVTTERNVTVQKDLAEQANVAKSMFLATMSHEIRSPLTAIIGFSNRLNKNGLDNKNNNFLTNSIRRNSQHLLQLINNIMDITKIEAGQLDLECVEVSPFKLIAEIESSITVNAQKKGLRFKVNYNFPLPAKIVTDPIRFKQILINLCSNAVKFTNKGSVNINVSCDDVNKFLIIDVIDTGIGLSEQEQKVIFESFTQADSSTTRKYGGSGLGLHISKELARSLGGELSVSSSKGKGSKFSITTAINGTSETTFVYEYSYENSENGEQSWQSDTKLFGTVLLAEDVIDNQKLIELYVTDTGAKITIVNNGREALSCCESNDFDLILMDMQMPIMDGYETIVKMRAANISTPIVMLTANAMKSDYEKCIDAGASDFLTKPIDVERFNQVLYKFLSRTQHLKNDKSANYKDKFKRLTNKFLNDLPKDIERIKKLRAEHSWDDLEKETHILMGRGSTFGYPEISNISGLINQKCRNHEHQDASDLVDRLDSYCDTKLV